MPAAKKPQTHATRRRQSAADSRKSALIWYGSGVVSGALASLLVGLSLWPVGPAAITAPPSTNALRRVEPRDAPSSAWTTATDTPAPVPSSAPSASRRW
ncbi:MAG TPA: hypothetical protein PL081_03850, partial [Pseudomonadales bacterium]|nr:hypothetical protein [Pseudomonadales bacterium]